MVSPNACKRSITNQLSTHHLYKSFLGKRTDDVSWEVFRKQYNLGHTLTSEEKKAVKQKWGDIARCPLSWGYHFFEMAKAIHGFNPTFIPSAYYMPYIFERLNPTSQLPILAHKGLQRLLFKNIPQPKTVATCLSGGRLYDNDYNPITLSKVKQRLSSGRLIIKPAYDSSMGREVRMLNINDSSDFNNIIKSYGYNFIIQEVVRQSEFTGSLNSTSLNCMRITSINLNNKISIENMVIKIGAKGQVVDNIGHGSGGLMIGLDSNGTLSDFGFRVNGTKVSECHYGNHFGGHRIPNFSDVQELAIRCHSMIPSMGIVGWDIALDNDNKPVLIEANSYWPGITIEQIADGPIFGERTQELIEYLKKRTNELPPPCLTPDHQYFIKLNNGVLMPQIGLGTFLIPLDKLSATIGTAYNLGYRQFDTAWRYYNEKEISQALKDNNIDRRDVFITTKVNADALYIFKYHYGKHRIINIPNGKSIEHAVMASFENLGTDYVDLFLVHWPWPMYKKMYRVLTRLYHQGRIHAIGVSNFTRAHLESLKDVSDVVPAVNQFEISPLNSQKPLIEYCNENGIAVEAMSTFSHYRSIEPRDEIINHPLLLNIANEHNKTVVQVVLRWLIQQRIIIIPKTWNPVHLRENIAITDFELSDKEMREIDSLDTGRCLNYNPWVAHVIKDIPKKYRHLL